jgi:hypothetical protein
LRSGLLLHVTTCASVLEANAESKQGRWLTAIPDPTEDEIPLQSLPG